MTDNANRDSSKMTAVLLGVIGSLIAVMFILGSMHNERQDEMVVKVKLLRARVAIESIELAIDKTFEKTRAVPKVATLLTPYNQNQPATSDWALLGYSKMPALPPVVESLRITENGDVVVRLVRIDKDIDGSTVRADGNRDVAGSNWKYTCSSGHEMVKQVFGC